MDEPVVDETFRDWSIEDDFLFALLADSEDMFEIDLLVDQVQVIWSRAFVEAEMLAPFESGVQTLSPLRPVLVVFERHLESVPGGEVWEHPHAPAVSRFFRQWLGDDATVSYLGGDHQQDIRVRDIPGADFPNVLFVPAQDPLGEAGRDPRAMQRIVARLRAPNGCPWDRKQDHQSLARNMVDEVYEAVDAIDRGDTANLAEELGDLFLLILMQAQIAHEHGDFSIEDVYEGILRKIVGRHPHVFGDEAAANADDVVGIWQQAKARERTGSGKTSGKDIDGEPFSMPALARASRVLKKHPVTGRKDVPPLLREVAAIIESGGDPDAVLRDQLRHHVTNHS